MHGVLPRFTIMATLFAERLISLSLDDKLNRVTVMLSPYDTEALVLETGKNNVAYGGTKGLGDTASPFGTSMYVHPEQYKESDFFSPLQPGTSHRDPPHSIVVREGHASPESFETYTALELLGLQLVQQEYAQRHGAVYAFRRT